jgi:hypothetical protein
MAVCVGVSASLHLGRLPMTQSTSIFVSGSTSLPPPPCGPTHQVDEVHEGGDGPPLLHVADLHADQRVAAAADRVERCGRRAARAAALSEGVLDLIWCRHRPP